MRLLTMLTLIAIPLTATAQTAVPQEKSQAMLQSQAAMMQAQTQAQIAQARQKSTADTAAAMNQPRMQPVIAPPTTK